MRAAPAAPSRLGWVLGLLIAVVLAAAILAAAASVPAAWAEMLIRLSGMSLQLLGVLMIALRLRAAYRQFETPLWLRRLWAWVRARFRPPPPVVGSGDLRMGGVTAAGRGWVGPHLEWTVEERVASLEQNHANLYDGLGR
jgi:cytochrome c biogenesis protein CcdA